jgi:hypothetical protein
VENQKKFDIDGEEMLKIVKDLCDFGFRRSGTPPADKAEKYIYDKLKEVGIEDVKFEPIDFTRWWAEKHELTIISEKTPGVSEDQTIESFPGWFSASTPLEGITTEVVYAGFGTKSDFDQVDVKDKIALIEGKMVLNFFPTHNERLFNTISMAKKKGAVAVICTNGSPLDTIAYIIPTLESVLPTLSISNPDGAYLIQLCTRFHKKLFVKFTLTSKTEPATSNTVVGTLAGKTDDIILIGTHTDSTFTGALDNAAANAGLIILAKHYAKIPLERREKTMLFVGWTGHECGSIGSKSYAKMHEDMLSKITTYILLDGFGCNGYYKEANEGVIPTGTDERRGLFVTENSELLSFTLEAVMKYKLLPAVYVSARAFPVADLPAFVSKEVPSILIIGKPILYHTKLDTIDIITPDQIERSTKAHIEIIDKIQATPAQNIKNADGKLTDINQFITKKEGITIPSVVFYVIPEVVTVGVLAIFVPSVIVSPDSVILAFEWKFEDGMTSDRIIMVRTFRKPGNHKVTFKIKDNFGNENIYEKTIKVLEKFRSIKKEII